MRAWARRPAPQVLTIVKPNIQQLRICSDDGDIHLLLDAVAVVALAAAAASIVAAGGAQQRPAEGLQCEQPRQR